MTGKERGGSSTSGGIGFLGLLTIVFIVLKLLGGISWPWLWVFAPLWLPLSLTLLVILVICIVTVLLALLAVIFNRDW